MPMKKIKNKFFLFGILIIASSALAQGPLNAFHEVTLTVEVQPFLQLKMEGPDQIDFTFDEINKYYTGIARYGATTLKVSATVNWDLWAVGLSQGNVGVDNEWDIMQSYQVNPGAVQTIPLSALELHQTPANPGIGLGCTTLSGRESDYSSPFAIRTPANTISSNNLIYNQDQVGSYTQPVSDGTFSQMSEKYIAGGLTDDGTNSGCGMPGGSYILETSLTGYYYVIDYRLVPGLPVRFPAHDIATAGNGLATSVNNAYNNAGGAAGLIAGYAQPGVYTMYVKFILAQDQ